jgi:hypothetical protein
MSNQIYSKEGTLFNLPWQFANTVTSNVGDLIVTSQSGNVLVNNILKVATIGTSSGALTLTSQNGNINVTGNLGVTNIVTVPSINLNSTTALSRYVEVTYQSRLQRVGSIYIDPVTTKLMVIGNIVTFKVDATMTGTFNTAALTYLLPINSTYFPAILLKFPVVVKDVSNRISTCTVAPDGTVGFYPNVDETTIWSGGATAIYPFSLTWNLS